MTTTTDALAAYRDALAAYYACAACDADVAWDAYVAADEALAAYYAACDAERRRLDGVLLSRSARLDGRRPEAYAAAVDDAAYAARDAALAAYDAALAAARS